MRDLLDASGLPPDVRDTVITVGSFDGVHRGHQLVLGQLVQRAAERHTRSVLVTFDPHPLEVVNPSVAPHLLTVGDEKLEVIAESGVDYVALLPFTRSLAALDAAQFVDQVLVGRFRVAHLLMGHDHAFGKNRSGNPDVLRALGRSRGFSVEVLAPVTALSGQPVSSTFIRRAVAGGDLLRAEEGLGRPYAIGGRVSHGEARGRLLGFPTINVPIESSRKLIPPQGVYAVRVQSARGTFGGMMNLGPRPTFGDAATSLEVHLFDVSADFYGLRVRVDFVAHLRDTARFDGVDALVAQLRQDEVNARRALAGRT
ncbi:MAG: bifunctional riboflavin kinase/FAD synthetase [Gemmatimonadaceae bacterium]|nr:bifunctional riboflavin kinase/FAD synthetase [Gemmatimonadaceae bacterium]